MTRRSNGSRPHTNRSLRDGSMSQGPASPRGGWLGDWRGRSHKMPTLSLTGPSPQPDGARRRPAPQHDNDNVGHVLEADSERAGVRRNSLGGGGR